MPSQHITEETTNREAILVPLDLDEFAIVSQEWLADGTIRVKVMATTTQATCPHCHKQCVKIHDTRPRKKRDRALREHRVELIVLNRRFRCLRCRKAFTAIHISIILLCYLYKQCFRFMNPEKNLNVRAKQNCSNLYLGE